MVAGASAPAVGALRWARVIGFRSGFAQGWRTPVDKDALLFCTADDASPSER